MKLGKLKDLTNEEMDRLDNMDFDDHAQQEIGRWGRIKMTRLELEEKIMLVGGVVVTLVSVAIVAVCLMWIAVDALGSAACLDLGYSWNSTTWAFGQYCGIEIDETDYVVPMAEAAEWMEERQGIFDGGKD